MSRLTEVLGDVRDVFTTNLAYKALALAFALMMWIWVQSEQVVEDRARVRLEWRLPEGLMLVEPPLETATVTVEGVQAFVRAVRQKDLSILVDLSRAREGEVSLDLSERAVNGIPPQVRVVSVSPSALKVQLDRVLKRRVNVTADTRGDPADGFRLAQVTVEPDRVELSGPSSLLRKLTEVQTDTVDVSGLREDAEFEVGLAVKKGQLTPTRAERFTVAVKVEPIVKERAFEAVPVLLRNAEDYVVSAEDVRVTLAGPVERLNAIDPEQVSVVVHVPEGFDAPTGDARRGRGEGLRYEVVQPAGEAVSVVDVSPERIPVTRK
ncbi:MAG: CdaR family protein [Myxococcota bacterium]